MIVRFYAFLWLAMILAAALFYLSGTFTLLIGVAFGFICFGLTFMGMIAVLPSAVHDDPTSNPDIEVVPAKNKSTPAILRIFTDTWTENGVEVRKPIYR